uniref:polysaccharide pyruvyl transferase family protein n=1 Tax=uncultured Dysgonomonas sp. TaxID=206096 RepID=UPI00262A8FB0|nr:polysaccharide pyruvyl transferase family protein [uncultured Dysgonomonas sp.]
MIKVGIFTLPLHVNYGGILQAYALQAYLKKIGYDAWLIHHKKEHSNFLLPFLDIKRIIQKKVLGQNTEPFMEKKRKVMDKYIHNFMDKYIYPKTQNLEKKGFHNINEYKFDALIVGSDQVWRYTYIEDSVSRFYLDFAPYNTKKISYAASFGVSNWEYSSAETQKIQSEIKSFSAISVREDSALSLCRDFLNMEAVHVIDPTLLLTTKDYNYLIENCEYKQSSFDGNIFTYILDSDLEKKKVISKIEKVLGLKSFSVYNPNYKDVESPVLERIMPPIEDWLNGIRTAEYIITDSFHGCVFSILYNKPFIVYGNVERGLARFSSLLKMFNLEDRIVFSSDELSEEKIKTNIDWDNVNECLTNQRLIAKNFLESALK